MNKTGMILYLNICIDLCWVPKYFVAVLLFYYISKNTKYPADQ